MDSVQPGGALTGDDLSSLSSSPVTIFSRWTFAVSRRYQHLLDKTVPHILYRWIACLFVAFIYAIDPEIHDGPTLPTRGSDEFRPFVRRLPEFKFWYSITKAFCIAFLLTFFDVFDVPVFWPILLFYWLFLFVLTMRRQIMHMVKYRYVPFSSGKQSPDPYRQFYVAGGMLENFGCYEFRIINGEFVAQWTGTHLGANGGLLRRWCPDSSGGRIITDLVRYLRTPLDLLVPVCRRWLIMALVDLFSFVGCVFRLWAWASSIDLKEVTPRVKC
ncbi:hypothetical protein GH714_032630 [Hevea brasiliensis]|uniref:Protein RER1 n=1 Tax=Hevea brasiliensis TaxID=3981 RepID=A0A6A6L4Y3_HEVBR|nr:hypothetical protein GH714_032630 [Hevea brasiliensis]